MLSMIKYLSLLGSLVLLLLLCLPAPVQAQDPIVLTDDQGEYPLGLHLEILEDKEKLWSINDVTSPEIELQFVPSRVEIPNFGFTPSAYWVRFRVRNEAKTRTQWQLELDDSDMQSIELYLAQPGQVGFVVHKTGNLLPFETRDVPHHNFIFNLPLPPQAEQIIYLRFENESTMRLPLTLWSPEALTQKIYAEQFKYGLFYGVLLIMLGYNLFLFLSLRDRGYFYYLLFLLCFLLGAASVDGLPQRYLGSTPVWWVRFALIFFSPLTFIAALNFTSTFLVTEIYAPKLHKILLGLQIGLWASIILIPFVPHRFISRLELSLMLLSLLIILMVSFRRWYQGYRPARYFLLAWLGLVSLGTLAFLARLGLWPVNVTTQEGLRMGIVLLVLLWSLALADRINLLKAETERANRQLGESEQRFRNLVEGSIQGILVHRGTKPLFANPAYANILGYDSPHEILAMDSVVSMIAPYEQERLLGYHVARVKGESAPTYYEYDAVRKDGKMITLQHTVTTIPWDGAPAVLAAIIDITERKQAEQALKESEERYRDLIENANDIIYTLDLQGRLISINKQGELLSGYSRDEAVGKNIYDIIAPEYLALSQANLARKLAGETEATVFELEIICKNGRRLPVEVSSRIIFEGTRPVGVQGIARDVSVRKHLEAQLRQAQKLEAIGRLAGGVAHDFNNLLTTIIGFSELALAGLAEETPAHRDIDQVVKTGQRAATLTRQLLAFSREGMLQLKVLNLNSVVSDLDKMLSRLIGEDIEVITALDPALEQVKADPSQLEQVILNLAVNARDAMPQGGKLIIETANVYLDEAYTQQYVNVKTGPYVMLAISDTGVGMDAETQAHLFEPFFTTKEPGQGTGLGLATVYGIVNQSGGHIWVYSEPGQGTMFKIYLPRVQAAIEAVTENQVLPETLQGSETILLVEDEEIVRKLVQRALLENGYRVLAARHGAEAIQLCHQHSDPIDLLITDVVMPGGMSGPELVEQLRQLRPELKVLYISGYTDNTIVHYGLLGPETDFLQKPFSPNVLARKVREVLNIMKSQA